ncbi:hypothetical protein [Streptomyces morookaense]|uniref:hypothetical protein n=1 Tax=Streptomyces morookaense TaxID=1970 RepID=UPI0019A594A2|nr:hypothetical protein [Streptomyces morookaense]GHF40572.1 hypothetical protein GCM10010359_48940 [Streptomyces morookaense]
MVETQNAPRPEGRAYLSRGRKVRGPVNFGLLSAIGVALYPATVTVLALTATFARRPTRRREARTTLALLLRARGSVGMPPALSSETGPES